MTVEEVHRRTQEGEPLVLLDVREDFERDHVRLPDSIHIPMGDLPDRWRELDPEAATVVYCHHGIRSAQVTAWLRSLGFARVHNLEGGIDAWAARIDPDLPRY